MNVRNTSGRPHGERLSELETWVKDHDKLCADRYGDIKSDMRSVLRLGVALLFGIIGWLAVQLWNGSQANQVADRARIAALERPGPPVTVVQSQAQTPKPVTN